MSDTTLAQLRYRLKLDAPALLTTMAGDPNTVEGETYIPGSSLLGAIAAAWISRHQLGSEAHRDPTFARWFLRGGLTFLNAYPEAPDEAERRLLPVPLSLRGAKQDERRGYDLAVDTSPEADRRLAGFCRLAGEHLACVQPHRRLRLHTARADRLLGRPTPTGGALFAYEALEGGQTFIGHVTGPAADLKALAHGLGWTRADHLTCALGRSRTAEYGGQARLTLLCAAPDAWTGEVAERQEPDDGLVLTLTSHLLPDPDPSGDNAPPGQIAFPFRQLAERLGAIGVPTETATLRSRYRCFTQPVLVGGYSGIWRLPRPQVAGLAAGSVFCFGGVSLSDEQQALLERQPLGQRTGEGFGRFVLNWHGAVHTYRLQDQSATSKPPRPTTPPPETFQRVGAEVARRWAADRVRTEATALAQALAQHGRPPSAAQLRRVADLLRGLDLATAPALREQLNGFRDVAKEQLRRCSHDGTSLWDRIMLLCSPDVPEKASEIDHLLGAKTLPKELESVLSASHVNPLGDAAQRARLANLFVQVCCAELARRIRASRTTAEGRSA